MSATDSDRETDVAWPHGPRQAAETKLRLLAAALRVLRIGPALVLFVLMASMSFLSPYFFTPRNLGNVLAQTAVIATLSLGQQMVILTRGIDLSVGSNLALCSV